MAHRFVVPDSSPAPFTPGKKSEAASNFSFLGDNPSTTPAGPPPSSQASFTPAGAPSEQYLGSSLMQGMRTSSKPFSLGVGQPQRPSNRTLFGRHETTSAPLGQSIKGRGRQPSGLSQQYSISDEDAAGAEDAEREEEAAEAMPPHSLFLPSGAFTRQSGNEEDAEGEDMQAEIVRYITEEIEADEDAEFEEQEEDESEAGESSEGSEAGDMFLNMRHDDRPYGRPVIGEGDDDLIMLNTPAATKRVRSEAESIFRRSSARLGGSTLKDGYQFAIVARDISSRHDAARITESADLILKTEDLICQLYEEGVGAVEDAEKMDDSLANVTFRLHKLWNDYVDGLPQPEGEDFASIGPGNAADSFEKAAYVANLILRIHHARFDSDAQIEKTPPLPEVLFEWQQESHNLYPAQIREISRVKPSPACHELYWQTLRNALLRGDVSGASQLLRNAGWEDVQKGPRGDKLYTGKALENVRRAAEATCEMLDKCPALKGDWDVWNSSWTLFRVQARGSLDKLTLFAEGRETQSSDYSTQPQSMSSMARKASSKIPWDVYENLQIVYGIVLGTQEAILETAQDWCEATVGLLGWWDDGSLQQKSLGTSYSRAFRTSGTHIGGSYDFIDRLGSAFRLVHQSNLSPNPVNPVEVAIASCFEGNVNGVIGLLRMWSLTVACSVAEIASLGQWLPPVDDAKRLPTDTLDMDDLALLGVMPPTTDEMEGIKDTTLVLYARELAGIEHLSSQKNGWEMAIQILGRMDEPRKSEETVGELLRDLLATLDESSRTTVDRMWGILNDLGMITFAEETAETFADILSRESHRYGEALWYYALSHRPGRVREVLNLLMSYSLMQSTAFPPDQDLDEDFKRLLRERTETLEAHAKQDLEAAQLLGRMLSGYATLRKFYEIRDGQDSETISTSRVKDLRKQAVAALVAVISSSDDNIRGGLYDETRDAVVSEDFLLALLGEVTIFVNTVPNVISLDQIDILLKAIEDLQTVGSRVYESCEGFLETVLASGRGLKGSTPADLMKRSTASLSGSSYVMSGSSMLASHMHKSTFGSSKVSRGWDWRNNWKASSKGADVLRKLRLGLGQDLARLWLEDADGSTLQ